jgi:membrane-anchored protein YejM (alkaline phosphatase superfamily)
MSVVFVAMLAHCSLLVAAENQRSDLTETMKQSIIYLKTSSYGYTQGQPWRHKQLSENWVCACAVGEYEVITTAQSVVNIAFLNS